MTTLVPFRTGVSGMFDDLRDLRQEMDGLMNRFIGRDAGDRNGGELGAWFSPACNVAESEGQYEISMDLPGVKPESFDIEFRQGDLWITGRRQHEHEEKGKTWHRVERRFGEFRRVIRLDKDIDLDKTEAEYKDGVLRICLPKAEAARTKHIEVKS